MRRSLLLIHPGALGDVLLALPAIRAIRAAFPTHECGLIAGEQVGRLLFACEEVDRLFPLEHDNLAGLLAGTESVASGLRFWLDKTDLVIGWMKDSAGSLAATLYALGAGRVIIRSPFEPGCTNLHQADRHLEIVASTVGEKRTARPLRLPEAILQDATASLEEAGVRKDHVLVAVHPGSGSLHKCCEPGLFVKLVARLQALGAVPILLAGPADTEQVHAVRRSCVASPLVFEGQELISVAGVMAQASLYVGHDSGLTHLAACLDVPTIALFGPTDPKRWAPRGSHVQILSGDPCLCNEWKGVQACTEKRCLQVPIERVMEVCLRRLRGRAKSTSAA
nr:glycosyltransferase family 9 protein [Nitrospirota bacterium]